MHTGIARKLGYFNFIQFYMQHKFYVKQEFDIFCFNQVVEKTLDVKISVVKIETKMFEGLFLKHLTHNSVLHRISYYRYLKNKRKVNIYFHNSLQASRNFQLRLLSRSSTNFIQMLIPFSKVINAFYFALKMEI